MFHQKVVRRLRALKKKKITDQDIIAILDLAEFDDFDFEITDELLEDIMSTYNMPVDHEKEALVEANRIFNQSVKGIQAAAEADDDEDDDWEPVSQVNAKAKDDWEKIQNKLDMLKSRYEDMTSR